MIVKNTFLFLDFANVHLDDKQQLKGYLEQVYPECRGYPLELFISLFFLENRDTEEQFSNTIDYIFFYKDKLKNLQNELITLLENPDLFYYDPLDVEYGNLEEIFRKSEIRSKTLAANIAKKALIDYKLPGKTNQFSFSLDTPHICKNIFLDLIARSINQYIREMNKKFEEQKKRELKRAKSIIVAEEVRLPKTLIVNFYQCITCKKWINPDNYQLANSRRICKITNKPIPMYCQTCSTKRK